MTMPRKGQEDILPQTIGSGSLITHALSIWHHRYDLVIPGPDVRSGTTAELPRRIRVVTGLNSRHFVTLLHTTSNPQKLDFNPTPSIELSR